MDSFTILNAIGSLDEKTVCKALSYRPVSSETAVVPTVTEFTYEAEQNMPKQASDKQQMDKSNSPPVKKKKHPFKSKNFLRWGSIAACFCLLLVGAFALIPNLVGNETAGFVVEDGVLLAYTGEDENVIIPDNVVCIADYAFKESGTAEIVKTVTLGKKVSTVETFAFDGCINLKTVSVSEKNKSLQMNRGAVLSEDGKQLIYLNANDDIKTYTVPNGVERICSYAFVNSKLVELTLPETVTTLDSLAVIFNDTLEKVTLNGVTHLSDRSFYNNIALKSVEMPKAVVVGEASFSGCASLEAVVLPNTIEIKKDAFANCKNLKSVNAPKAVTIGESAFYDCDGLATLSLPSATTIGDAAFRGCDNLSALNVQNATSLGDWFVAETNVSVLILPKITEGLGEFTFAGASVELWGEKGSYLESFAKENNFTFVEMKDIDLPTGFSPVNDYMYVSVSTVNVRSAPETGDNVVGYLVLDHEINRVATDGTWSMFLYSDGKYRFVSNSCLSVNNSLIKPSTPTDKTYGDFNYIDQGNYIMITKYTGTGKNILIPGEINGKPVEEIKANAFASIATSVESIQANSIKRIAGTDEFLAHCYKLQSLEMTALEELPSNAFYECVSLNQVELTNLKKIGSNVFVCGTFTELYLTKAESIADDAFTKSGIKTLHGTAGSYAQTWATTHQYGFVDVANDYTPTYPTVTVEADKLTYATICNGKLPNGEMFGQKGIGIAHDSTGKLYLYVEAWNKYIPTTFVQFEDFASTEVHTEYQTAATYGNYAWLIASNGNGASTKTLSVLKVDKNGTMSYGQIDLGGTRSVQGLYCDFSSEQNGKLIVYFSDQYQRCMVYETKDGGATWNKVVGDITSAANRHETVMAAGFVTNDIGFVSYRYVGEEQPGMRTYLTVDGGKTWKNLNINLSSDIIKDGYGEVVEMSYDSGKLILTVIVRGGSFVSDISYEYVSADNGTTWTLQNS